ncbi:MAG: glucose-1-phosphate adenylyltransferase [Clostridiales bacterium]|nr:glucose-1-phosphate adenylyltransferase [Clostridiales bacterium]
MPKKKKEWIAMLLAGGQGSRLCSLTGKIAKSAVKFGGKYRIIDFTLTNCVNSGIDTVGVLTQYQPHLLNEYLGTGVPWDLDRMWGGLKILPPYQRQHGADWYRSTANAIYQNIDFINRYDPDYVIILSGDHIYRMDYRKMLEYHKEKNSDCTIAVLDVPLSEAGRFGIMSTDNDGRIIKFTEKPKIPESTKASMGIYIFGKDKLISYLEADDADAESSNDFGKNVIPSILAAGEKLYAYEFEGYWKDVGTVSSLWEANMDMLGPDPKLNLNDKDWSIYSRQDSRPPQHIGRLAVVENSVVTEGCEIYGSVINCVLGSGVRVMSGARVRDSVLMDDVLISEGARVDCAIVDTGAVVGAGARVGAVRDESIPLSDVPVTVVGSEVILPSGCEVTPYEKLVMV